MTPALVATETEVIAHCLEFLALHGVHLHRRNVGGMRNDRGRYVQFGESGQADYFGTYQGRTLEIEFKRTGYRPHGQQQKKHFAEQVAWLNGINAAGGIGLVIDRVEYLAKLWPAIVAGGTFRILDDGTVEEI